VKNVCPLLLLEFVGAITFRQNYNKNILCGVPDLTPTEYAWAQLNQQMSRLNNDKPKMQLGERQRMSNLVAYDDTHLANLVEELNCHGIIKTTARRFRGLEILKCQAFRSSFVGSEWAVLN
jgi:hypothetical protein